MKTEDLIACAEFLMSRPESEMTQADINRAGSTIYYALFHKLSETCANLFMGPIHPDYRRAWQQAYRALGHENAKSKCRQSEMIDKFPTSIQEFADKFVTLQETRHQCDYDPLSNTSKTTIDTEISTIRDVVDRFGNTPELDLRAFCSFILFPMRDDPLRKKLEEQREEDKAKEKIEAQKAAQPAIAAERAARRAAKAAQEADTEIKA